MVDPHLVFAVANNGGLVLWGSLLLSLFVERMRAPVWLVTGLAVPALWAVAYILLLAQGLPQADGGFDSIAGVRGVFANDAALAAGWLHYLAFDLFVGTWIARDGLDRRVPALLLVPCIALTLLFGPAGFLLYLLFRLSLSRKPGTVQ